MTVPDYQTLMAPALQALADGTEQPISQLRGAIAKQIGLTDADLKVTLPARGPSDSVHESSNFDRQRAGRRIRSNVEDLLSMMDGSNSCTTTRRLAGSPHLTYAANPRRSFNRRLHNSSSGHIWERSAGLSADLSRRSRSRCRA